MSLLIDAGIDPGDSGFQMGGRRAVGGEDFRAGPSRSTRSSAGRRTSTTSRTKLKGTRLVVTTGSANHLIADVWAVRNDFYRDHPDIVADLVRGIFEGMDMVRKDVPAARPGAGQGLQPAGRGLHRT